MGERRKGEMCRVKSMRSCWGGIREAWEIYFGGRNETWEESVGGINETRKESLGV